MNTRLVERRPDHRRIPRLVLVLAEDRIAFEAHGIYRPRGNFSSAALATPSATLAVIALFEKTEFDRRYSALLADTQTVPSSSPDAISAF